MLYEVITLAQTAEGALQETTRITSYNVCYTKLLRGKGEDTERAARIQELKAQVASGEYQPDLNKVASSLLKFLING